MLNMLGGNRIYVVPEIHFLLERLRKFKIIGVDIDELPLASEADRTCVYYKATGEEIDDEGVTRPVFNAYVPAERDGEWVWYSCTGSADYEKLRNLPHYKLEEEGESIDFKGEVSPVLAQPITAEEIREMFDSWPSGDGGSWDDDNEGGEEEEDYYELQVDEYLLRYDLGSETLYLVSAEGEDLGSMEVANEGESLYGIWHATGLPHEDAAKDESSGGTYHSFLQVKDYDGNWSELVHVTFETSYWQHGSTSFYIPLTGYSMKGLTGFRGYFNGEEAEVEASTTAPGLAFTDGGIYFSSFKQEDEAVTGECELTPYLGLLEGHYAMFIWEKAGGGYIEKVVDIGHLFP